MNIPLGSTEGRQCVTLRRLRTQQKLVDSEIAVLDSLNFTWHSLEDVYQQQKEDFDDFLERLRLYAAQHEGDVSPPKKYPADPELGAWVTALRRLYPTGQVDPAHVAKLDRLGFSWTSPRQCGSTFMQQYRTIRERLLAATNQNEESSSDSAAAAAADVFKDPSVTAWIRAQQQQASSLSETRKHYMVQLLGPDWMTVGTADSCLPSLGTTDATV